VGLTSSLFAIASYRIAERISFGQIFTLPSLSFVLLLLGHVFALNIGDNSYMLEHLFSTIAGFAAFSVKHYVRRVTTDSDKD
jgi:hypothetical protein